MPGSAACERSIWRRKERRESVDGDRVFSGRFGEHLVDPKKSWFALLKKAEIEDLRIRDLRSYPEFRIIPE
jgi:hypothetical protein